MKFVCYVLVALGLSFLLVGCETSQVVRTPPSSVCVLKKAGELPRQKLRYQIPQGQMEKLECTNKFLLDQHIGGYARIFWYPSLRHVLMVKAIETLPDGTVKIGFTIDFVQALDQDNNPITKKIKPLLTELPPITGSYLLTPTGKVKDIIFAVKPDPDDENDVVGDVQYMLKHILNNMTYQLPQEPIGIGAVWSYQLPVRSQTFSATIHMQVTLVGYKADNAQLKFSFYQSVQNRHFRKGTMHFKLKRHIVHGQGESQMSPSSVVPTLYLKRRIMQRIGVEEHGMELNVINEGQEEMKVTPFADL